MFSKQFLQVSLVVLCVTGWGRLAAAQGLYDPKPVSRVSGPTGEALNQIYRSSIGQGFSGSSLNSIALQNARERVPYVGQSGARSGYGQVGLGLGGGGVDKPFSSISPEPTVSPYMNLFREDFEGNSDVNYNTLVRPQLQQQQFNQQVQRQSMDLARRLQSLSAQADFNPQGDRGQFPTGHKATFRYMGHYYSMPTGRRRGR